MQSKYILTDGTTYIHLHRMEIPPFKLYRQSFHREDATEFFFDEVRAIMQSTEKKMQWLKRYRVVEVSSDAK